MSILLAIASSESAKLLYALFTAIVTGTTTVVVLVIKNWCKLLSGTYAVMHRDEQRRADARLVYERALDNEVERGDDSPEIGGPTADQRPPGRWRGRRRRKRRR
jgi:hypothetical protein